MFIELPGNLKDFLDIEFLIGDIFLPNLLP